MKNLLTVLLISLLAVPSVAQEIPDNDIWGKFPEATRGSRRTSIQQHLNMGGVSNALIRKLVSEKESKLNKIEIARKNDTVRINDKVEHNEIAECDKEDSLKRAADLRDSQIAAINQKYNQMIAEAKGSRNQAEKDAESLRAQMTKIQIQYAVVFDKTNWLLIVKRDPNLNASSKFLVTITKGREKYQMELPYTDTKYVLNGEYYVVLYKSAQKFDARMSVIMD